MRLHICAVGRLRGGPEAALTRDYAGRFDRLGRSLGLGPLAIHETDERKAADPAGEATLLRRIVPGGAIAWAMDERGTPMTSPDFAAALAGLRDRGAADLAFLVGGADGLDAALVQSAGRTLSLGPMVWPHLLARAMLAEQLYRAASILAGTPYHRN